MSLNIKYSYQLLDALIKKTPLMLIFNVFLCLRFIWWCRLLLYLFVALTHHSYQINSRTNWFIAFYSSSAHISCQSRAIHRESTGLSSVSWLVACFHISGPFHFCVGLCYDRCVCMSNLDFNFLTQLIYCIRSKCSNSQNTEILRQRSFTEYRDLLRSEWMSI